MSYLFHNQHGSRGSSGVKKSQVGSIEVKCGSNEIQYESIEIKEGQVKRLGKVGKCQVMSG